jgi:hypothetical protein
MKKGSYAFRPSPGLSGDKQVEKTQLAKGYISNHSLNPISVRDKTVFISCNPLSK